MTEATTEGWDGVERRGTDPSKPRYVKVQLGQYAPIFAAMVVSLFIILGVLSYGIINTNNRAREGETVNRQIGACILTQLTEHRSKADYINREVADRLTLDYPRTGPGISPDQLNDRIIAACDQFSNDEVLTGSVFNEERPEHNNPEGKN